MQDLPLNLLNKSLKARFGTRLQRISLEAGMTCPNRDGTKAIGGCSFCTDEGSSSLAQKATNTIEAQLLEGIYEQSKRFELSQFIAYFQSFTNTYAPLAELKRLYDPAIDHPCVRALAIGTRPDAVPDEVLGLIDTYAGRTRVFRAERLKSDIEALSERSPLKRAWDQGLTQSPLLSDYENRLLEAARLTKDFVSDALELWLDVGVQTTHNTTQVLINRAHTWEDFVDAVCRIRALANPHIRICTHIILGLPGEDRTMMLESAKRLSKLDIDDIKIHQLCIFKSTPIEIDYLNGDLTVLSEEAYIELLSEFLSFLPAHWTIQRLMGEGPRGELIAPDWAFNGSKQGFLNRLRDYMLKHNLAQGSRSELHAHP